MDMDYNQLLKRAKKKLPDVKKEVRRFEIPEISVEYLGRQTILKNFSEVAKKIRREPKHIAKFLFKELASPGSIRGGELLLQTKIPGAMIKKRINEYIKEFVICGECGKPDTKIFKSDRVYFIKCESCGAKKTVRRV